MTHQKMTVLFPFRPRLGAFLVYRSHCESSHHAHIHVVTTEITTLRYSLYRNSDLKYWYVDARSGRLVVDG